METTRHYLTAIQRIPLATRFLIALLCALVIAAVPACGGSSSSVSAASGGGAEGVSASGAAWAQPAEVPMPETGGEGITIEHANDGYVSAAASSDSRLKFQVACGDMTYNYDMPNDGSSMVYPVNMGDGSYSFRIMQNTSGSNYVELESATADVKLTSEFYPFLLPNMFCDYDAKSACVEKAREITADCSNEGEVVRAVCTFVAGNVSYDNAKAEELSTSTGYVPEPDQTLSTGKGICFDYASLSAAMLRSLGIPTKVTTGFVGADQLYHAWIMVYVDGSWQAAEFSVSPNTWSRCDVTFASTGATKFSGDGSSYTDKYTY